MIQPLSRRAFLERAAVLGAAAAGAGALLAACNSGGGAAACNDTAGVDAAGQQIRTSLQYVSASPDAAKTCDKCALFTAGQGCGTCSAVPGPIAPGASCSAFSARA